ncbi:MAG: M23 family metallopeptidase [Oscillospiraceae bacterium]|nr:M23 family metallopeptidase [Oscillospiraceae bacterium]
MKKVRFSGFRKFIKGKGFATALVLSIGAVGISAYVAYNSTLAKLSEPDDPDWEQEAAAVENPQRGVPRASQDNDAEDANSHRGAEKEEEIQTESALGPLIPYDLEPSEEANNFIRPESPKVMPVEGEVITPFSNGELVKSNTLGVWRTHDAVDIAANLGTEVRAIQRGTISEVYTNVMWGICVTIDHGNGVISSYMGLDKDVTVAEGTQVEAGDVIGLIGNTAEAEIADPPSLHLAIRKNDEWIDPIAYIND